MLNIFNRRLGAACKLKAVDLDSWNTPQAVNQTTQCTCTLLGLTPKKLQKQRGFAKIFWAVCEESTRGSRLIHPLSTMARIPTATAQMLPHPTMAVIGRIRETITHRATPVRLRERPARQRQVQTITRSITVRAVVDKPLARIRMRLTEVIRTISPTTSTMPNNNSSSSRRRRRQHQEERHPQLLHPLPPVVRHRRHPVLAPRTTLFHRLLGCDERKFSSFQCILVSNFHGLQKRFKSVRLTQ